MDSRGEVLLPLRDDEVLVKVQQLVYQGVRGFVVTLLYSYANPAHERRISVQFIIRARSEGTEAMREVLRTDVSHLRRFADDLAGGVQARRHARLSSAWPCRR